MKAVTTDNKVVFVICFLALLFGLYAVGAGEPVRMLIVEAITVMVLLYFRVAGRAVCAWAKRRRAIN